MKERFDSHWTPEPFSGCWLWTASIDHRGYGMFRVGRGPMKRAHRVSFEIYKGSIPAGLHVLHDCDTGCCVNPDHLHLGTAKDNALEAAERGLLSKTKGEHNGNAKLTPTQVITIRNSRESYRQISARFGVKKSQIGNIKKGTRWKHLQ